MEPVYWSVDECRWVRQVLADELWLTPDLPQQRVEEPVEEPVDA